MNHRRSQHPIQREPKPFRAMATPKSGFEQEKKLGSKKAVGIGILAGLLFLAVIVGVFLIRGRGMQTKAKPTITPAYIGLASPTVGPEVTHTTTDAPPATNTSLPSTEPSPSNTLAPSDTPTQAPSDTPTSTPSPTSSPTSQAFPYTIRNNSQLSHVIYFPNESCGKSVFVVGQALDYSEKDIIGYEVRLTGIHGGKTLGESSQTGSMPVFGPSGFGFVLSNTIEAGDEVSIQLFDKNGRALSKKTIIELSGECDKNLRLIRYKQTGDL